ncbi:Uncharacterized protein ALO43_02774 [Pseudomonas tremae]|uniref:Uncharacterized protein n=2 Tax=Pseudomonas TaxID=286 RepID=A0AA40P4K8_9PSED|nr:Uncharacterized protein ALO43_02774 [Pseudomonas tremae]RMO07412.1 hypothetical protein ALQ48_01231 [Pseudomonas coronafaciens pv. zizaniae]
MVGQHDRVTLCTAEHGQMRSVMRAKKNSTFRCDDPFWANACVGNNGSPSYVEYSIGFSTAANVLIDKVLEGEGLGLSVDYLVYPVCFNMRHSVELRLKGAIDELIKTASYKGRNLSFDLVGSHDIGNIWNFFRKQSEELDNRYTLINSSINPTISDIAEIDPTGQTFRYAYSNESQKHLTDVSSINFVVLKEKFGQLEKHLDILHDLSIWLRDEYAEGTFTRKFSRPMLYRLANELPPMSSWADPGFAGVKRQLMEKYEVGSNELGRAINKIKDHYVLASKIGDPLPLKGIRLEQLLIFFDHWIKQNPQLPEEDTSDLGLDYFANRKSMLAELISRGDARKLFWEELEGILTPEVLAGLHALFYFSNNRLYVEYYDTVYRSELAEASHLFRSSNDEIRNSLTHIFDKTNAMTSILISLYALGHQVAAEYILERYGIESFHWLEAARSGELFAYPLYAGY